MAIKLQKQAWCLNCLGGGKAVGQLGTQRNAERDATSHMANYGHTVIVVEG